jgi:hypothetical protein
MPRSIGYFAWGCFQYLAGFTSCNNLKEAYPITGASDISGRRNCSLTYI